MFAGLTAISVSGAPTPGVELAADIVPATVDGSETGDLALTLQEQEAEPVTVVCIIRLKMCDMFIILT